jgi:hypothetical protein
MIKDCAPWISPLVRPHQSRRSRLPPVAGRARRASKYECRCCNLILSSENMTRLVQTDYKTDSVSHANLLPDVNQTHEFFRGISKRGTEAEPCSADVDKESLLVLEASSNLLSAQYLVQRCACQFQLHIPPASKEPHMYKDVDFVCDSSFTYVCREICLNFKLRASICRVPV